MKKIISNLLIAVMLIAMAVMLAACGGSNGSGSASDSTDNGTLSIVTTIFPEYDWVNAILGDNPADAEVTMLLDNGVDLHSYQPTADDILKIADCDIFVYVGGESDGWVDDALAQAGDADIEVINLLDVLGNAVKEEEAVEGMETEEEEGEEEGEEEPEYDEHVWLSLKNTEVICRRLTEAIKEADPSNADDYDANAAAYIEELEALDSEYTEAVKEANVKTLVFGDRFPFRYLTDDYDLDYYAAFAGCSAESEASFETITFLAKKIDELGLNNVMAIEGTSHSIAETVAENAANPDVNILVLDSMQSTTSADDAHYIDIMRNNLEVLKKALAN